MVKALFLTLSVLIAAASAQVTGPGTPVCHGNETFTHCGPCDGFCTNLHPTCEVECDAGCLCNPGYVRDSEGHCIKVEDCPVQCGANEELNTCYNACEDPKCIASAPGDLCPIPVECVPGCACKRGFVRDPSGKCVKPAACPIAPTTDCSTLVCLTPGGCAMVQPLVCLTPVGTACPLVPQCVNENQCLYTRCPRGFQCILKEVPCDTLSCDPVAQCVPIV
ncbi:hypothetical protein CAEBREN_18217 [Caenorhabditis brenneri]|uniref:TIL domain-containing protein n=1 Tax=Caenorhabditis brenneri TaxID=135651 RepID=G0NJ01_CAEBE|nr:hypothetical protein CAEBREN_18217 [Caenorhabditis brenneri]